MSKEPLFSVVIPTRNRAHLLRYALQSALDQDFDDYEIVVSDNCSQDNTEQVVNEASGTNIRYVRPEQSLSMPDHWEFALDQARGKYVTYLCDDDALAPTALQRVSGEIGRGKSNLVVLGTGLYYGDNWFDVDLRNSLNTLGYSGEVRRCTSQDTLLHLFKCRNRFDVPRMLNSFCEREAILRVRARVGKMFLLCPDYSFPSFILTHIPVWTYIDKPLRLQGIFAEGIGASQLHNRGESSQEYLREFNKQEILERVPLKVSVVSNYIAETLLMAKEKTAELADIEINWPHYFVNCWLDILEHEKNGVNVKPDKAEFFQVLEKQAEETKRFVSDAMPSQPTLRNIVTEAIVSRSAFLTGLRTKISKRDENATEFESRSVRGSDAGFTNILECASHLEAMASFQSANNGSMAPVTALSEV